MSDNEAPVATEPPGIGELADQIANHAHELEKLLAASGHPSSNGTWSAPALPQDEAYERERTAILEQCRTLTERLVDPAQELKDMALTDKHKLVAPQIINHYSIANKVPTSGQTTFQDLARACNLPQDILIRILRQAMIHSIFYEPQPNHVAHTPLSLAIPSQAPLLSYQLEIALPSSMNLLKTLKDSEAEGEGKGKRTAFQIAHKTTDNFFSYAEKTGTWTETYGQYQSLIAQGGAHDISHLLNGYDWANLGEHANIVDIGGGDGTTALTLAHAYPNLHITVQDFAALGPSFASKAVPSSPIRSRVRFTAHPFFDPQPSPSSCSDSTTTTVFLLRHILHDWPTADCQRILRHLVDAMRKEVGSKLVVAEQVMPREFDSAQKERVMRAQDMQMMVQYGSQEREMEDWEELFSSVGLRVCSTETPKGSADTIMEVVLKE